MSYLDNLAPGEVILHRSRRTWFIFADTVAFAILAILFAFCVYSFNFFAAQSYTIRTIIALSPFLIALILLFNDVINYYSLDLAVTNKRILVKTGLMGQSVLDIQLSLITNTKVDIAMLGMMFNYGTLTILTATGEYRYTKLDDPQKIKSVIVSLQ